MDIYIKREKINKNYLMMIPFGIIIFLFYMLSIIRKLNLFKKKKVDILKSINL